MGYKAAAKIAVTLTSLGLLLYTLYKNPYLILPSALAVGVIEAIDFYRSGMNPARMYTFKLLDWILKD
jgi:hypothetical protein